MTPKTRAALEASIKHWEKNLAVLRQFKISSAACALCDEFRWGRTVCGGCPVMAATKQPACYGSPYKEVAKAWVELIEATEKEIAFLRGLLPAPKM